MDHSRVTGSERQMPAIKFFLFSFVISKPAPQGNIGKNLLAFRDSYFIRVVNWIEKDQNRYRKHHNGMQV